jgi:hypothetical protein
MKAFIGIAAAVLLCGLGFFLLKPAKSPSVAKPLPKPANPPTSTLRDPAEVFQKAFWKRPGVNDKILHAERREWADAEGVQRWQWFIVVEPSTELVKHLREDNAFGLDPAKAEPVNKDAPAWFVFKAGDVDVLGASRGKLRLIFSKSGNTLYATDAGGGFHHGAPEPARRPSSGTVSVGRLPLTPPPVTR